VVGQATPNCVAVPLARASMGEAHSAISNRKTMVQRASNY